MNLNLSALSWQFTIFILLGFLFFLWLFFGGGDHQYIGLNPLKIGYDATKCKPHDENSDESSMEDKTEEFEKNYINERNEEIDHTPSIPDLRKIKRKVKTKFRNSSSEIYSNNEEDEPSVGNLVKSTFFSTSESYSEDETMKYNKEINSPRSLSLGPYCEYKNEKKSKGEILCKKAIEEIYEKPFYCVRPNFLKNPETGRNLELDLYNDELKIAIEYSGSQHYKWPNNYHKTYDEFISQVRRDQYKINVCDANGIYLITVPYNVPNEYESIKKYIEYYLPENAHLRK
jgi:hypothetical protein